MIQFPGSKINLGLNVLRKRSDGYHDLNTCFYPLPWTDSVEVVPSDTLSFHSYGIDIPGNPDDNLCIKAYREIQKDYKIGNVAIHLLKNVPMGAGLGGGSADAAAVINLADILFDLKLSGDVKQELASRVGSDCPFFIERKPVIASGRGTEFKNCKVNLSGKYLIVIYPGIHVTTKEAYSQVVPMLPQQTTEEILSMPMTSWKDLLKNDFERSVFQNHPALKELKHTFYNQGAIYASMSGSGSAVFGIFDKEIPVDFPPTYKYWKGYL